MIFTLIKRATGLVDNRYFEALVLLAVRLQMAMIFWSSARTKVEPGTLLTVNDTAKFLFAEEYHMPFPEVTAVIATFAEHALPILLVLGLATRCGAAGMLVMTMVIQIFVYPDAWWTVHVFWTLLTLVLICRGGGMLALDRLLERRFSAK